MNPALTTITAYWNRPQMFETWLAAMHGCAHPEVEHLVFYVDPPTLHTFNVPPNVRIIPFERDELFSIGHCHNAGARIAKSEWIMKIDVDTLPSVEFFSELLCLIWGARPLEWFNVGMVYIKETLSKQLFRSERMPISKATHQTICANLQAYSQMSYCFPSATNFVCRRIDYLTSGGCDVRFNGYGWEDYQQIYMLEYNQLQRDPLPGFISLGDVTRRCRDEISRRKARELFERNNALCLFHHWHRPVKKDPRLTGLNKQILLDCIERKRTCKIIEA